MQKAQTPSTAAPSKMSEEYASPPKYGPIARPRGFLILNNEDASPMATHGQGTLASLIKSRSTASLQTIHRRQSVVARSRESQDDEEAGERHARESEDTEDFKSTDGRRLSLLLNGPQMRSQRLIGNSNPRYRWGKWCWRNPSVAGWRGQLGTICSIVQV